jgi:3-dehydroquinate dehydratase II
MKRKKVLVIHGPNLNMLGLREPEIYGRVTFAELNNKLKELADELELELEIFQSNHEGALIDKIQEAMQGVDGILINPGGLSHTSVALKDALSILEKCIVEVHISNIHSREKFRHFSHVAGIADAVIVGFGIDSYLLGLEGLARLLQKS